MRHIISVLLQNEAGALARLAGLFSSRGYNIESLTVAPTQEPSLSRLTVVTSGSDAVIDQINKQLRKLIDVVEIVDFANSEHLESELLMLKVRSEPDHARELIECVRRHRGIILDESETTRTVQLTGTGAEINEFVEDLARIAPILELVRSGAAALARGESVLAPPPA
jgi:acetolactate synthase-1/3 small subunit